MCTTLYRNPIQVSNFSGSFDQLFLSFFYAIFTQDAPLLFLYMGQRSHEQKPKSRGPAFGCVYTYPDKIWISGYPDVTDPDIFGAFTHVGSKRFRRLLHGCTQDPSLAQSASSYSVTCSPITSLQEQQLAELRNTTHQP